MAKNLSPHIGERRIYMLRGRRIMFDYDLAELYDVGTKVLNQAVKRNRSRFPMDFMFQITRKEAEVMRSQIVTASQKHRNVQRRPYVFTEQGVAMLSSVLKSKRAIRVNIAIMRAFVKLREMLATNQRLARRLETMEKKYDKQFKVIFEVIQALIVVPEPKSRPIGFALPEPK